MSRSSTNNDAVDSVWGPFKEIIRSLYLDKDLTLEDIRSEMETTYQFFATKSQYELRFRQWGFRKYRTKEDWQVVAQKITKRKREHDKDSEVYFSGTLIPPTKVRKETSRYSSLSGTTEMRLRASSPRTPEGIIIRTPPVPSASPYPVQASIAHHVTLDVDNGFSLGMEIGDINSDDLNGQIYEIGSQLFNQMNPSPEAVINDGIRTLHASMIGTPSFLEEFDFDMFHRINMEYQLMRSISMSLVVNETFQASSQPLGLFSPFNPNRTNIALDERHSLLCGILSSSSKGQVGAYIPHFTAILQRFVPERQEGDMSMKVQKLFDPSNKQPLYQLFEIASYFSSNNILSTTQTDVFLKWVIDQKYGDLLKSFLQIETPTIQAFSTRILESVIRIKNTEYLQLLITSGFKFDGLLEQAIQIDDPQILTLLLRSGVDSSSLSGTSGGRLLHKIARTDFTDIAQILVQYGADVNLPTGEGRFSTTLSEAVAYSNIEMLKCLLDSAALVNMRSRLEPYTALAKAVHRSKIDIIIALLDKGADVSECFLYGQHILEYSALEDKDVYEVLLQKTDNSGRPIPVGAIIDVAEEGTEALSDFLHEHKARLPKEQLEKALAESLNYSKFKATSSLLDNDVDPNGPTLDKDERPLMNAALIDGVRYSRLLINKGASIDLPGLLKRAAEEDHFELFSLLIDEGADLEAYGPGALEQAAKNCSFEMVALLLEKGLDVNTCGKTFTALQKAAWSGNIEFAEYLIEMGADINAPASAVGGRTALQRAAESGKVEMVAFLLDQGAEINAPPALRDGITALEAATSYGNSKETKEELFTILLDRGASFNRPQGQGQRGIEILHQLVNQDEMDLVRLVVESRSEINVNRMSSGRFGNTALQLAAGRGNMDMVKLLLEYGAEVNVPPGYARGRTALQAATSCAPPQMELVQLLVEKGAEVNAKAGVTAGLTALQGAAIRGHIKIALFLLEKGADVNARPAIKDGRTAIEGAAEHGRLDMVHMLLNAGARGDVIGKTGFKKAIELAEMNRHFAVAQLLRSQEENKGEYSAI